MVGRFVVSGSDPKRTFKMYKDMAMDWKLALKIGGPSVIAAWLFRALIIHYLDTSEILKTNIYLNVLLIVLIFAFCLAMGWLWMRKGENFKGHSASVEKNEIVNNEVGSDMGIGSSSTNVKKNKIKRNKVDGNLKIG